MPDGQSQRLDHAFYARASTRVAPDLIGCDLVRILPDGTRLRGTIVETEAYLGVADKAAHSFGGRRTPRTEPMYAKGGTSYVYFTYGMHYCFNVVCGKPDDPVAVLVRALEPREGIAKMIDHRSTSRRKTPLRDRDLCSGPARLCQALQITPAENALDLISSDVLWIEPRRRSVNKRALMVTPRVGIQSAEEWAPRPLRWLLSTSDHVSRPPASAIATSNPLAANAHA